MSNEKEGHKKNKRYEAHLEDSFVSDNVDVIEIDGLALLLGLGRGLARGKLLDDVLYILHCRMVGAVLLRAHGFGALQQRETLGTAVHVEQQHTHTNENA